MYAPVVLSTYPSNNCALGILRDRALMWETYMPPVQIVLRKRVRNATL